MGTILNKLNPSSSSTSGSGDDGSSRIAQALAIFATALLIFQVFAGSAAAATVADISTSEPTYDESSGTYSMYIQHTVDSASSGDTDTITVDEGTGNLALDTSSVQVAMSTAASVTDVTDNGDGTYDISISYDENISSTTQIDISTQYTVSDSGEATVSVANTQQSTTFQYTEPQGTVEVGSITTSDGASVSPDVEITDSSGTVVASASNISESYSTQLAEGNYTVSASADGYKTISQQVSVSYNTTTTVDFAFQATTEPTGTVALGEFTTWDNGSVDSVDIQVINSSDGSIVASASNVSDYENYTTEVETGTYTVEVSADGYATFSQTSSVSENSTTTYAGELQAEQVDYELTVVEDGSALETFSVSLYEGDTIGENETPVKTAESTSSDGNTVSLLGVSDGSVYTVEIQYDNGTTYTHTFTVNSSEAENGIVSETVDVAGDNSGFIGGVSNPFGGVSDFFGGLGDQLPSDPVKLGGIIAGGFIGIVGILYTLVWVKNGLKMSNF